MKAEYDKETDTLTITLRDARVKESDEVRPGVIADFGYDGGVVGFEILQASKVVEQTDKMQSPITDHRSRLHRFTACRRLRSVTITDEARRTRTPALGLTARSEP
jgi:uncharacterized protein YuzE